MALARLLILPILLIRALAADHALASSGAAAYLQDGVGARWSGMGGAACAAADDVHAAFFNPAGLSRLGTVRWQVGSMVAFQNLDRSTSSLSFAHQTDAAGSFAASWVHRSIDGLEYVDGSGNASGETSSAEDAFLVSGAYDLLYQVRVGSTIKVLRHAMFGFSGSGFGLDLGVQFLPVLSDDLWIGVTGSNLAGALGWADGASDAPARELAGGAAWRTLRSKVLIALDVVSREGGAGTFIRAGVELRPLPLAALRLGWDGLRPAAGASYVWKPYQLDYAFAYDPDGFSSRHLLSFLLHF